MLDNFLIEKNFKKSLKTYNQNAIVQKIMAEFLVSKIKNKKYPKILEIGSYTGILTQKIINNFEFENYVAVDIVNSFDYIKNLSDKIQFIKSDFENFSMDEKFDLIISSATLQWCNDLYFVINKLKSMIKKEGTIAISVFGKQNLIEIKETFGVGLNYCSSNEIKSHYKDIEVISKIEKLHFKNSIELLRHLKFTGVNSLSNKNLGYKEIKEKLNLISEKYNNTLTYEPVYIIIN